MRTVILLETSITRMGVALFESAKKMGVHLVFLYQDIKKYEPIGIEKHLYYGVSHFQIATNDFQILKEFLFEYQKTHILDGIICLNDRCIENASKLAEVFGFPFMNSTAVSICRNKDLTAQLCKRIGIRTPRTYAIQTQHELSVLLNDLTYPVILKPSRGFGSTGVTLCRNNNELSQSFSKVFGQANQGIPLVQEYVLGPLVSVEGVIYNGKTRILGISSRIMGPLPHFVEMGSSFPIEVGTEKMSGLSRAVNSLVESLNIQFGTTHTEFILSKDGPVLIEMNPRLGGGLVGQIASLAYDFDLFSEIIRLSFGEEPQIPNMHQKSLTECFLYPTQAGRIRSIEGIDLVTASPGVEEVYEVAKEGDDMKPPCNYASRSILGVLASGETTDISSTNCLAALKQAHIEYY